MIVGLRHAWYLVWIRDIAQANGIPIETVVDPLGNLTDRLEGHWIIHPDDVKAEGLTAPIRLTFTVTVPPPPDDWVQP